jgi:hypothetical protein
MAGTFGIQHKRDGRWFVGFTADRAQRLIWSGDKRQAWSGTREAAEAQACLLAKYHKTVSPDSSSITGN